MLRREKIRLSIRSRLIVKEKWIGLPVGYLLLPDTYNNGSNYITAFFFLHKLFFYFHVGPVTLFGP